MFASAMTTQDESVQLEMMQRAWQPIAAKRSSSGLSFLEEQAEQEAKDLLVCASKQDSILPGSDTICEPVRKPIVLDASTVGDFPARYVIPASVELTQQLPVVGVYIDKRVIPGFKYRVRPLPMWCDDNLDGKRLDCLFDGRALTLQSIGRGYARRFTFEADAGCLNSNKNYFWSDNRPEGYVFELEVLSEGDKFTIFDGKKEAQGTVEVLKIEGPQVEIGAEARAGDEIDEDSIVRRARVRFIGKVEFFETGVAKPLPLTGIVMCVKAKGAKRAEVTKILNVTIKHHRYTLVAGVSKEHRRVTVKGEDVGDVPTKYTMTGLEKYEIPVVGTYVDPRIIPGFYYRIRPNDRKQHLFEGRTLKLKSIGAGYAKRLTFEPDSLLAPNNYLWSDNHPDGLGLEPRAVHDGMRFAIVTDGGEKVGEAEVFRADRPQREEKMLKVPCGNGKSAIVKHILVDAMCHVKLSVTSGGHEEEQLMRVCGLAIVRKEPHSLDSRVVSIENIGLDSQLKLIFASNQRQLTFHPIDD